MARACYALMNRLFGAQHVGRYDVVIRCLGWSHDVSVYNSSVKPLLTKFPLMTSEYESINVPGMYVRSKSPLATENLLENTDGAPRPHQ